MVAGSSVVWREGEVVAADLVADAVRRIVIRVPDAVPAPPGAHVDVRLTDPDASRGRQLTRSYSVVRSEEGGLLLTLGVRLAESSRGGGRAMHALAVGDRLQITRPLQNFPLGVGAGRYLLLAGGVGVTALVAMAATLRRRGDDYRVVQVARTRDAVAFGDDLAGHGDRLRLHVDDDGDALDVAALVAEVAEHPLAADTELYVCGPIRLMDAVRREWAHHALPPTNLRFETFGSSGSWAPEQFTVSIPADDREVVVPRDLSPLEALEAAGVEVMSDCRKGECGLCAVRVQRLTGHIDHRDVFLDDEQKASNTRICLCVSRVAAGDAGSAVLVIDRP